MSDLKKLFVSVALAVRRFESSASWKPVPVCACTVLASPHVRTKLDRKADGAHCLGQPLPRLDSIAQWPTWNIRTPPRKSVCCKACERAPRPPVVSQVSFAVFRFKLSWRVKGRLPDAAREGRLEIRKGIDLWANSSKSSDEGYH